MREKPSKKTAPKKTAPKKPLKKQSAVLAELRSQCIESNVEFTEKEGIKILRNKLKKDRSQKVTALAVRQDASLPYALFDQEDDKQLLAELQGQVVNKFVYRFEQDDKEIVGLSKSGVEQVCRESANRKGEVYRVIDQPMVHDEGQYITVTVKAGRYKILMDKRGHPKGEILLDTTFGSKRQWKMMRKRDRSTVEDRFFYEKALSKAIRNAKMALIPYVYITEMVKVLQKKPDQVHTISAKVGEPQIKYIHGLVQQFFKLIDYKDVHSKATEIVRQAYGYGSVSDLQMDQVNDLASKIKAMAPRATKMPIELIGLCNEKGILPAKREALWQRALEISPDVGQATILMKESLERERTDEQKG